MNRTDVFVTAILQVARSHGYRVEVNRYGLRQIDFGHKRLHEGHLRQLYPEIVGENARISALIDSVAPGRPCSHLPMKRIIAQLVRSPGSIRRNLAVRPPIASAPSPLPDELAPAGDDGIMLFTAFGRFAAH
jgi:hypothetical protein